MSSPFRAELRTRSASVTQQCALCRRTIFPYVWHYLSRWVVGQVTEWHTVCADCAAPTVAALSGE